MTASLARTCARILLGAILVGAGVGHLTWARDDFTAQVPSWVPFSVDFVVVSSGIVEIVLGLALLVAGRLADRHRMLIGIVAAAFFVAVFPGNISQYRTHTDAFGLDTDGERLARLFFQPVLVVWALWCTDVLPFRRRSQRS